jgi:hypothetical protein
MPKYDIPKIKMHLRLLAHALRESKVTFRQAQREGREPWGLKPADALVDQLEAAFLPHELREFKSNYSGAFMWGAVSLYFTRLCCLRATMRERSHLAPDTSSATLEELGIESRSIEDQREWAEVIADRYWRAEEPEETKVRAAG